MSAVPGGRLPRGRHGLSREEVVQSQRGRIFFGLATTMAQKGYVATSIADILKAAGVSRETFYQQFTGKEDCFVATLDAAIDAVDASMFGQADRSASPHERFDAGLRIYLDAMAAQPAFTRLFLVEVYAAGPAAVERRERFFGQYVDVVADLFGASAPEDRFAAEALMATTMSMATARLAAGDADGVRALHGPLVALARRLF